MAVKKIIVSGHQDDPIRVIVEQFNDLLAKIDADIAAGGATEVDYRSTLEIQDSLTNQDV
jgi:hypothetical protein